MYTNVCGKYEDKIISKVEGLEDLVIPVVINVKGSPIVIPSTQLGVYFNEEYPVLSMKPVITNTGKCCKSFKVLNTGGQDIIVDWKILNIANRSKEDEDMFSVTFERNEGNESEPYKINFNVKEPEEANDTPFTIEPKRILLSPKEQITFEVSFDSSKLIGKYEVLLVAHPMLADDKSDNLGVLYVIVRAESLNAHLTIDKKYQRDGKPHIQFDICPSEAPSKKINFVNELAAEIAVNIETTNGFDIIGTLTNSTIHPLAKPDTIQKLFYLLPGTFLEVECKANYKEEYGRLILNYANKSSEEVILRSNYLKPKVSVHIRDCVINYYGEEEYDFGDVSIGKYEDIFMFIKNETKATAKWHLSHIKKSLKKSLQCKTITKLEREEIESLDDQKVFAFSEAEVLFKF